jgi:energy-coupling factor transporter ATP-binding protein EcfA2
MNRASIARILEHTLDFLEHDTPVLAPSADFTGLEQRAETLLEKARHPGEILHVGILGGTGVGKSTLINALAGEEVSSSSDRRPHTDKAVLYRHRAAPGMPEEISHLLRDPDALHDSEQVKYMLLLDLPDFDSVNLEHHRTVNEILPWLDCVIWVASPEKYADEVFYRLVRETRINRENFTFVLNKADEFKQSGGADPHAGFKEILGDFTFRLKHDAGVEEPRVFILSAAEEFTGTDGDPILEEEFKRFRDFLMVRRNAKEIASVKTVNLVEETRGLLEELRAIVRPDDASKLVESLRLVDREAAEHEPDLALRFADQEERIGRLVYGMLLSADSSISPVSLAMRLIGRVRSTRPEGDESRIDEVIRELAKAMGRKKLHDLESTGARMDSELALALRDSGLLRSKTAPGSVLEEAVEKTASILRERVQVRKISMAKSLMRLRRFFQTLILLLPIPVFLLALAGGPRLDSLLNEPNLVHALGFAVSCLTSLFTSRGLDGLIVLLIFEVVLAFYLAGRRLKRIEKDSRRLAESAGDDLDEALRAADNRVRADRQETINRIADAVERFSTVNAQMVR